MPLTGERWLDSAKRPETPSRDPHLANWRWISPGYLETLRVAILRGRAFTEADRRGKVALVSERTAEALWPGEDPVQHQVRRGEKTYTVVGVVADTRGNSLKQAPGLVVYLPYWDNPPYPTFFMARTRLEPGAAGEMMRRTIWSLERDGNIAGVRWMEAQVNESLARERAQTFVLLSFGGTAVLLAALGIYGVLSYSVSAREREIGVRLALGANQREVYRRTTMEAVWPVLLGLIGGVLASLGVGVWMRSLLVGVNVVDVPVTVVVMLLLGAIGLLAAYVPSRRAAATDPAITLRAV